MARYVYRPFHPRANQNGMVNVLELGDWRETPPALPVVIDRHYWNLTATDGTDIGSRTKHREYMRQNGLTTADDYKETWAKAEAYRAKIRAGDVDHKERRETIARTAYEMEKKNARRSSR